VIVFGEEITAALHDRLVRRAGEKFGATGPAAEEIAVIAMKRVSDDDLRTLDDLVYDAGLTATDEEFPAIVARVIEDAAIGNVIDADGVPPGIIFT